MTNKEQKQQNIIISILFGVLLLFILGIPVVGLFISHDKGYDNTLINSVKSEKSDHYQKPVYSYQEYRARHKKDKGLLELLDLYNSRFNSEYGFHLECYKQPGMRRPIAQIPYEYDREACLRYLDVFCSQTLWAKYGIYTNINPENKDCFCKYGLFGGYDKTDRCVLVRRNAVDEDIGFFDYKFFLPDDLKMSKDRFKQVAKRHIIVNIFENIKCWDNDLELLSTERKSCAEQMKNYILNLSYNKMSTCKKKYNLGQCSDKQIYSVGKARKKLGFDFYETNKKICEQIKRIQFEIDNNCVLKE